MMSDPTTGLSDPSAELAQQLNESSLGTTQPPNSTGSTTHSTTEWIIELN